MLLHGRQCLRQHTYVSCANGNPSPNFNAPNMRHPNIDPLFRKPFTTSSLDASSSPSLGTHIFPRILLPQQSLLVAGALPQPPRNTEYPTSSQPPCNTGVLSCIAQATNDAEYLSYLQSPCNTGDLNEHDEWKRGGKEMGRMGGMSGTNPQRSEDEIRRKQGDQEEQEVWR